MLCRPAVALYASYIVVMYEAPRWGRTLVSPHSWVCLPFILSLSIDLFTDTANADTWLPLIFLTDLYTHSLLTMGDDEFFSGLDAPVRANAPRNSLTLDEITSLSRKLLNIAFTLFWREGQIGAQDGVVPGLNIKWEAVRRKVTRLLQAVHVRE